jgi:plastocyanin
MFNTLKAGALALALSLGAAGAGALSAPTPAIAAAAATVNIDNFVFGPETLTVAPGTTVTWTNRDDIPHTVVANDKSFKSKVMDTDEKFSFTFTKPGEYGYFCSLHPHMTGKVIVKAE